MLVSASKQGKVKVESIKQIHQVDFTTKEELFRVLRQSGIVKPPTALLPDLQKAVLNLYSPKTLQMFCQFLSPGLFIEDDKKSNIVSTILAKLKLSDEMPLAVPTTPSPKKTNASKPTRPRSVARSKSKSPSLGSNSNVPSSIKGFKSKPASLNSTLARASSGEIDTPSSSLCESVTPMVTVTPSKGGFAETKTHSKLISSESVNSPLKEKQSNVRKGGVLYEVSGQSAGYSKDPIIIQLERSFKLKKIRHLSRSAALHYLLLQTGDSFVILNMSSPDDKSLLTREYIYSKEFCNPDVIGWDIFAEMIEAVSVRDRLSPVIGLQPLDSSSIDSEEDCENNMVSGQEPSDFDKMDSDVGISSTDGKSLDKGKTEKSMEDTSFLFESVNVSGEGVSSGHVGSQKRLNLDIGGSSFNSVSKFPKLGSLSYDKSKVKRNNRPGFKLEVAVSFPILSKDRSKRHVFATCFFKKSSFKTVGVQAMLETALDVVEDTKMFEWVRRIEIVHKRKEIYGPNEPDMVAPMNQFPKFELLLFPLVFGTQLDSKAIQKEVGNAVGFIMEVLRSDNAVPFYQEYLRDQHDRLWERLVTNAETNKTSVDEYTKHFIEDFAKNEPVISYNVCLDHYLLDDDIKKIVNQMGYYTATDMTSVNFNGKVLYRDADMSDVPSWLTNSKSAAMPHNIVN
jgi:hypothetical protein